jgi:hypothetical protein
MTVGPRSCCQGAILWTPAAKTGSQTHMQQLLPIENPRYMAGLAKQKFAGSYREFDSAPQILKARTANHYLLPPACTRLCFLHL